MRMRRVILTIFVLTVSFVASGAAQSQVSSTIKTFPENSCMLSLPTQGSWRWGDPKKGFDGTIALAISDGGMILMLSVDHRADNISFEDYITECEDEATKWSNLRKLSAKQITFLDIPAYDMILTQMDNDMKAFIRGFLKNQTEYGLALTVPRNVRINRSRVEKIFSSFSWIQVLNKQPKPSEVGGSFTYLSPSDYKKFPEYRCQLRLPIRIPDKQIWKWDNQSEASDSILTAATEDGASMALNVFPQASHIVLNDALLAGFEKGILKNGQIAKVSGHKCQFKGVNAYQFNGVHSSTQMKIYSRIFIKFHNIYLVQYHFPKDIEVDESQLEQLYDIFSWIQTDEDRKAKVEEEREALKTSFVYIEDTTPDTTVYTAPNAKTVYFKDGGLSFQIDLATHELVDLHNRPTYAFFNVLARERDLKRVDGFLTNIPAWVQIAPRKQTLEAAIESRKQQIDDGQHDAIIVKEIGPGDAKKGNRTVILLYVRDFHDGQPRTYFGVQFTEVGDYVIEIEVDCAQGMKMDNEYKTLLNNVVQSSLRSLQANGKAVDTSVLQRHVRKK